MPFRPAAVLRTLLVIGSVLWAGVASAYITEPTPTAPAPDQRPPGSGGSVREPDREVRGHAGTEKGRRDPEKDLLDHLDVIQDLELLQNLDLFDTGAPAGK